VATKTKGPTKKRPVQHPKRRVEQRRARRWWLAAAGAAALALAIAIPAIILASGDGTNEPAVTAGAGLPDTPDYHSLLVAASNPEALTLGTHNGLYESNNGGRSWQSTTLSGQDAMNLARASEAVVWTAGHNVLAKSTDGGATWQEVRPSSLPGLDVHGFAVDPGHPETLYAAIAGQGLYRSEDGGDSFALVSRKVGPGVMALAVLPDGRILAGDMQQGLVVSSDRGESWKVTLEAGLMGLAVNPEQPDVVLATGPGILRSTDGGLTWERVMPLGQGAGPVAWAPSEPQTAYVVGFDQALYKTTDGGQSWQPVGTEE
jgi:photosystem II stability/assembly factor-like uncharacterized protein